MEMVSVRARNHRSFLTDAPAGLVCAAMIGLLCRKMADGVSFLTFLDEAVHVLGGQVLDQGGVLYRSFVDSHGPFIFMLAQLYGSVFGWSDPNRIRMIPIALVALAGLSCLASPAMCGLAPRLQALSLFTGLLAVVWLRQGFYLFSFYPLAGALCSIVLTGCVIPACLGRRLSAIHAFLAGVALICLVASAYSFGPSVLLFAMAALLGGSGSEHSGEARRGILAFLAGGAAGLVGALVYMRRFSDLHGYAAFHVAESQFVYARYISFSLEQFRHSLVPSMSPTMRIQALAVMLFALATIALFAACWRNRTGRARRLSALALMLTGILLLNARGAAGFQNGSFLFATITALAAGSGAWFVEPSRRGARLAVPACLLLLGSAGTFAAGAVYLPTGLTNATVAQATRWPIGVASDAPLFALIRRLVSPQERILALAYNPRFYLLAGRLPIDGFYAYFKWDADYAASPWFGRPHDLCTVLETAPPPVIELDEKGTWGFPPRSYIPCLNRVLTASYVKVAMMSGVDGDLYVRRDRSDQTIQHLIHDSPSGG